MFRHLFLSSVFYLLHLLIHCSIVPLSDNYNATYCSPYSFGVHPIRYTSLNMNRFIHNKFQILENFSLKRYEFIDSDYPITQINQADENFLRIQQTPVQIFDEYRIVIQNYQLLTEREFQVTMVNPSMQMNFCVKQIYIDLPEIKRIQHRKLPFCINKKTKYPFLFKMHFQDIKQRVIKCGIFFVIDLKDSKNDQFIQQRLWGKQVIIKVYPNWLKLSGTINFKSASDFVYETYEITNPSQSDNINLDISSSTNLIGLEDQQPTQSQLSKLQLKKGSTLKFTLQRKSGQILIQNLHNLKLQKIKLFVIKKGFTIQPINIGILPSKKTVIQTYVYASNQLNNPVTIKQIQLLNRVKTVHLVSIESFNSSIPPDSINFPIAIIRICPGIGQDQLVKNSLKVVYSYNNNLEVAQNMFSYYEIVNPLTNMQRRFFYLSQGYSKTKKRFQETLFQLKNSLNIPIKLSNVLVDEQKFKITWVSDKRQYIYPNHPNVIFGLQYIGDEHLPLPSYSDLMLLQFNGNIIIPVELIIYDKTLQCQYMNISNRCSNLDRADLGNLRASINNTKQFVIMNPNPSSHKLTIKPVKINPHTKIKVLGPIPQANDYFRFLNTTLISTLKNKHSLLFRFQINCNKAGYYSQILNVITDQQNFNIQFTYRLSQGMVSLLPNPLIIQNYHIPQTALIYLHSTFQQDYSITNIQTNISQLIIPEIDKNIIKPHEAKQINLVFNPKLIESLSFDNILSLIQNSFKNQYIYGHIKVKTSQDLQQLAHVVIPNYPMNIIPQRFIGPIHVVQRSINNKLIIKIVNNYNVTLRVKTALIEPQFVAHPVEAKYVMNKYKQKSSFYLCLSESSKSKLKLTSAIVRSLLHLDSSPTQVFIEAMDDGNKFYVQWHHRQEFKTYEVLQKQIGKRILLSIVSGSRYCFKGESTLYFKQLFNTQQFIRVSQQGDSATVFEFIQRQYQNIINPSLMLEYDSFYKKLNITSSKCFFRYCNYVPIQYFQQQYIMQPSQVINVSLNVKQSIQQLRPIAFTVISNIGRTQFQVITFKSMKMMMKLISVSNNNHTASIQSIINDTTQNYLPIQLMPSDYKTGYIRGERSFKVRNVGDFDINITSILFEDTQYPEVFQGFQILKPQGFVIQKGNDKQIQIKFKITSIPTKPVSIYLYSPSSYFFKLQLIVLPGSLTKYLAQPQSLYFIIGLIVLSTTYICLILRVVLKQKKELSKKLQTLPKSLNVLMKKPNIKLDFTYINQLKQQQMQKQEQMLSQKQKSNIHNIQSVKSVSMSRQSVESRQSESIKQDQIISVDDKSQDIDTPNGNQSQNMDKEEESEQYHHSILKKNSLDSQEQSLGSGSSLSDEIFAQINNFAAANNSRYENNSNSDKIENQSNDSLKFYNAFLSGGPLFFRKNSGQQFFDDDQSHTNEMPHE